MFGGIGKLAGVAAAGIGAAATATGVLVKSAVDGYAEYEQLVGGVDTLFKDSSAKVQEYAANAYKTAGLSANEYMSTVTSFSASLLQSLGGDTEKAAQYADQAITDMSDNANKMGTDMAMIQNAYQGFAKQNYTMLDNLKLGYGGTKTEMERLLSDAEKISGIKYDISNYADVTEAIHVMQTEIGITGTTAKEASSTIEGSTKAMKSAWQNLVVGIADDSQDFDTLVNNFVDSVGTMAENIMPRIETAIGGVGQLIEKLLPVIVEAIPGILNNVLPSLLESGSNMITTLIDGIRMNAPLLVESLLAILGSLGEAIVTLAPQFVQIGFQILSNFLEGILSNMPAIMDGITTMLSNIMENIREWLPELLDMGMQIVEQLITVLLDMLPELVKIGLEIIVQLALGIAEALPELVPQIVDIMLQIVQILIENLPLLIDAGLQIILGLVDGLIAALPVLIEALPQIIDSIIQALITAIPMIIDAGIQLFTALVEALPDIITAIVEALPQIIDGIISGLITLLPLLIDCGIELFLALIEALPDIIVAIVEALPDIIESIIDGLMSAIPKLVDCGIKLFVAIIQNLPRIIVEICKAVPQIVSSLIEAFGRLMSKFTEVGGDIVEGLWNGIKSGWDWMTGKVSELAQNLLNAAKEVLGVASPSKKFRYFGEMCVAGFDEGIDDLFDTNTINKSINASFGTLSANVKYAATDSTSGGINTDDIKSAVAAGAREGIEGANINTYLDNRKVTQSVDKELSNTETTKGRYGT